jgi:hypothetical protein
MMEHRGGMNLRVTCLTSAVLGALILASTGCGTTPTHFRGGIPGIEGQPTLAILAPLNLSHYENAEDIVMNSLIVEMLQTELFSIMDPGLVEEAILQRRIRVTNRLPLESLQALGEALGATYLMVGTINEFGFLQDGQSNVPTVSISLRIVTCASGQIMWATSHSRSGDDAETVFGFGRIKTLDQLASATVREMTRTLIQ